MQFVVRQVVEAAQGDDYETQGYDNQDLLLQRQTATVYVGENGEERIKKGFMWLVPGKIRGRELRAES